ncbi:MAG TPA: DUF4388 domain-containing protein [Acidothermaceae bacterium]
MKLEGSLDAFSLPDIFQLLSFTKKSGGLHLRRGNVHGTVYFRDGSVTGASSDGGRQALARRLVGSGAVGDDELSAAVERAANDGVGVGRALLDAGAVDADLLRNLVAEQAVDAVFDLLRWSEGDFSFTVDEPGPDDVGFSLGVEPIVNDARSRLETWEHACRVIPSPETVVALPVAVREDPQISRGEWALLALVDGRRSVAQLVALAGRGDYSVVSQLAALIERGLLAARTPDDAEGVLALARRQAILGRLEGDGSAAAVVVDLPDTADVPSTADAVPATVFAPLPATFGAEAAEFVALGEAVDSADTVDANGNLAGAGLAEVSAASTVASVLAAANGESSPFARTQTPSSLRSADDVRAPNAERVPAAERPAARVEERIAAHLVADTRTPVTPSRPEPFMPKRRPEFPDDSSHSAAARMNGGGLATATAAVADPFGSTSQIERDPSVNKSLLLRLIAGVRGL